MLNTQKHARPSISVRHQNAWWVNLSIFILRWQKINLQIVEKFREKKIGQMSTDRIDEYNDTYFN